MLEKKFTLWNRITAAAVFVIAALTYLLTIEPTASFWDCGEFIASSYKLEVGHPPGNPVFQLFARFFTIFTDNMHAAVAVNAMNAVCSALTIFFLYFHTKDKSYQRNNQLFLLKISRDKLPLKPRAYISGRSVLNGQMPSPG